MKFVFVSAALAAVTSVAGAKGITVHSNCTFPVFVQSFQADTGKAGKLTILHRNDEYFEEYQKFGAHVLMSKNHNLDNHLFAGYSNLKGQIFYELSDQEGNPFLNKHNKLIPSNPDCPRFNCQPGQSKCYSDNQDKVFECDKPVALEVTLCQ